MIFREELREYLNPIYDLERLIGRITYRSANPRDLIAFRNSLQMLPHIKNLLKDHKSALLQELYDQLDPLEDMAELIEKAIVEDPPITVREGGMIREGYNEDAGPSAPGEDGGQGMAGISGSRGAREDRYQESSY